MAEQGKMIAAYSGGCEYRDLVRSQGTHECGTGFEAESRYIGFREVSTMCMGLQFLTGPLMRYHPGCGRRV